MLFAQHWFAGMAEIQALRDELARLRGKCKKLEEENPYQVADLLKQLEEKDKLIDELQRACSLAVDLAMRRGSNHAEVCHALRPSDGGIHSNASQSSHEVARVLPLPAVDADGYTYIAKPIDKRMNANPVEEC